MTDRLALGTLVSRALLCSQSFSKNTLKSTDFPYHSIMIVQLTGYIHCFFARNYLMNIMCKVGDYILKVNNIAKTSTQTNTQNAVHRKLLIALLIIEKNRRLQKVRLKLRLRMR